MGVMPLPGRRAAGFAAAVAAVIATGCGAQHAGGSAAAPGARESAAPARAVRNIPLNVPNSVSARKAVTLTNCSPTVLGGLASGTVRAPAAKPAANYTITVFFTTPGTTVLDYATAVVHARPGKATPWQASGFFRAPSGMRCVLRGVSAAPAKP